MRIRLVRRNMIKDNPFISKTDIKNATTVLIEYNILYGLLCSSQTHVI